MKRALKPNGIVCSQGGTFWTELEQVKRTLEHCGAQFPVTGHAVAAVPTYPCGQIGFVIGSLDANANLAEPVNTFTLEEIDQMNLRYYTSNVHRAAFTLPRFAAKALTKI
jgi:spermidine synthase